MIWPMKTEKVVLAFLAILVGIVFSGVAFYFYQSTKTIPANVVKTVIQKPTPTPNSTFFLSVAEPLNESVVDKKVVKVSGKTTPDATIVIITESDEEVVKPSKVGDFSTKINIGDEENIIRISAFSEKGESKSVDRLITFSTEDF